jgi:hypothetical protein
LSSCFLFDFSQPVNNMYRRSIASNTLRKLAPINSPRYPPISPEMR